MLVRDRSRRRLGNPRRGVPRPRGRRSRRTPRAPGRPPSSCSKVKEPIASEYGYFRNDLLLFTYLHLAAEPELTKALLDAEVTAIAYETVQLPGRVLPLLAPMSEVAGRLAPIVGANVMLKPNGGPGLLVPGVPGTYPGQGGRDRWRRRRRERGDGRRGAARGRDGAATPTCRSCASSTPSTTAA